MCQCRKHYPETAQSHSGKGSSAKAALDPPAQGPGPPSSPVQRGPRAPGIFGATRAVSSRASGLCAPRASTASGGDVCASAPEGEGATRPGTGLGDAAARSPLLGAGQNGPTQLLPAPWEGSVVRPLEREAAAAGSTHGLAFCFSSLRTRERHNSIISFKCHPASSSFALQPSAFRRGISQFSNKSLSL